MQIIANINNYFRLIFLFFCILLLNEFFMNFNIYIKKILATTSLLLFVLTAKAQNNFTIIGKSGIASIPFQLKNNLILIPITINKQNFTFILDTGVSKTLLFNIKANDSVKLNNRKNITIKGLGANEYYRAIKSTNNFIKIKNIVLPKAEIYLVTEAKFDFSSRIGIDVHGLIGADLFKNFIVKINYTKKKITFYKPKKFKLKKSKKWKKIPLKIVKNKPYISLNINNKKQNLLLDSGSGDALWLFEDTNNKIPKKYFYDYLGNGLSGEIHGKKAKMKDLLIGDYHLKNLLVAYPDSTYIQYKKDNFIRNGIVGASILKRFKLIFDYPNKQLFLKKNAKFKQPFLYNKTGLDISYNGKILVKEEKINVQNSDSNGKKTIDFLSIIQFAFKDSFVITGVKKDSSGEKAGLLKGDVLIKINGHPSYNFQLEEIVQKLSGKNKKVHLTIERNGIKYKFEVPLIDYL